MKGAYIYQQIELTTAEWATNATIYPASVWLFERLTNGKFNMKLSDGVHPFSGLGTVMQDVKAVVKTNTSSEYVLTITTAAGTYDTPNLKGATYNDAELREMISNVEAIARGKARAKVFDTVAALDTWLAVSGNVATLQIGDNFYVKALNVPDYWWDGVSKQPIETEKVDLTDYVQKEAGKGLFSGSYLDLKNKPCTPTLDHEPLETDLTFTDAEGAHTFLIGDMVRVMDAKKKEYVFFQLYDIAAGKALWKKAGSGGDMQITETVKITLTGNQAQPDTHLNGAIVHVKYSDKDIPVTWNGAELTVEVPLALTYRIECPAIQGYSAPANLEYLSIAGNIRSVSLAYNTTLTTIAVSADDASSVSSQVLTVTDKTNSKVLYSSATDYLQIRIPFGISVEISVNEKSGYTAPAKQVFTTSEASHSVTMRYEKINSSQITFDKSVADPSNLSGDINTGVIGQILAKCRRCLCKNTANGEVTIAYLKNDNSNYYEDNTPSVLTGAEGDVMMVKPAFYYKFENLGGTKFAYRLSEQNTDGTYKYSPESLIGVYKAYQTSSKLYSRSGVATTASQTITVFETQAKARGTGYQLIDYEQHCMIALLLYARYGNRNLQAVLGTGGAVYSPATPTGTSNQRGNADTVNETSGYVNGLGIEGVFGGFYEWVSGVAIQDRVWTITNPDGTTRTVNAHSADGWIINVAAEAGPYFDMVPTGVGGSETTHYSDYYYQNTGSRVLARSYDSSGTSGGVACADAKRDASNAYATVASRLAFRGVVRKASSVSEFKAIAITN